MKEKEMLQMNLNRKYIICRGIGTVFLPLLLSGDNQCVGEHPSHVVCLSS